MQDPNYYLDQLKDEGFFEEPEVVPCPQCDGDGEELGTLGNVAHYRCRHCGWTFNQRF